MKNILRIITILFFATNSFADTYQINAGSFYYSPSELNNHLGDTVVLIKEVGTHDVNAYVSSINGESFNNPESFNSTVTNVIGASITPCFYNCWNIQLRLLSWKSCFSWNGWNNKCCK